MKACQIILSVLITLIIVLCNTESAKAQLNHQWVWESGNSTSNNYGDYGTKGISSALNVPAARNSSVNWVGPNGNFWLLGGSYGGWLSDLWMFDISTKEWTWVDGNERLNTAYEADYGIKGVSRSSNMPGARERALSFDGPDGNLWMMGGNGYSNNSAGNLNDLWKYNIYENIWTWVSGSDTANQAGIYGTKGLASPSNVPGARMNSVSWTGPNGNLWVMGGIFNSVIQSFNDLWVYDIANNLWTWVAGADIANQPGNYGTSGISSSLNVPGSRSGSISWLGPDNNLWLMGGWGFDAAGNLGRLNDLWRFDIETREWTWISGSPLINQLGIYGSLGVPSASNMPGARLNAVAWTSPDGSLCLMGGTGYDGSGGLGRLNDLWCYDINSEQWTWISGSVLESESGSYGSKGIISSSNVPGARENSVVWISKDGYPWLMGGNGYDGSGSGGRLNDLWQLVSDPGVGNFDGSSSFGRVAATDDLSVEGKTEVTVEFWVKMDALNHDNSFVSLVNRGEFLNSVGFTYQDVSNGVDLFFNHYGGSLSFTGYDWDDINTGEWYHIAGTFNNGNSKIYIKGSIVADTTITGTLSDPASGTEELFFSYDNFFSGAYLDGQLSEVRFWDKALTQQEIQSSMNLSVSGKEPGLMGAWLSRAGGRHSAVDQTGAGNNMITTNVSYTSDFPPLQTSVTGGEGWRFLGAPGASTSYGELLNPIWTQGYSGSDGGEGIASNVYHYDEATKSWKSPGASTQTVGTSTNNEEGAGKGILVYVYADDDNDGADDAFPKNLPVESPDALTALQIPLSYSDSGIYGNDGWNLVSNPYPVALYWQKIVDDGANNNTLDYAYIWDHELNGGAGGYQIHYGEPVPPSFPGGTNAEFDGRIPAFQSFWVKAKEEGANLQLQAGQFIPNQQLYKRNQDVQPYLKFILEGQGFSDELSVIIPASEEQLREEVPKLNSLSGQYAEIFLPGEQGSRWMTRHINSIEKNVPVIIPIDFNASVPGEFSLSWTTESVPEEWSAWLLDKQRGQRYDLSKNSGIIIESESGISEKSKELVLPIAPGSQNKQKNATPRFELILTSSVTTGVDPAGEIPDEFNISQNYPNPFNPTTQINYAVPQAADIQLVVYDMLGRKVATLVDRRLNPGRYSVSFDASRVASGIYIYRLQAGSTILTRKMTLIK